MISHWNWKSFPFLILTPQSPRVIEAEVCFVILLFVPCECRTLFNIDYSYSCLFSFRLTLKYIEMNRQKTNFNFSRQSNDIWAYFMLWETQFYGNFQDYKILDVLSRNNFYKTHENFIIFRVKAESSQIVFIKIKLHSEKIQLWQNQLSHRGFVLVIHKKSKKKFPKIKMMLRWKNCDLKYF